MAPKNEGKPIIEKNGTKVERGSDRELVTTRTFNGPARLVYEAWTKADLFKRWWVPKSLGMSIASCQLDVRVGGGYRLEFDLGGGKFMAFFGTYKEVIPNSRLVWTNEEGPNGSVTTVTFEEKGGKTLLVMRELFPSKEALEENAGMVDGLPETFTQLDEVLTTLA